MGRALGPAGVMRHPSFRKPADRTLPNLCIRRTGAPNYHACWLQCIRGSNMRAARWVRLLLTIALVLAGGVAHSEVYRWTDSNGRVHFGDRPDASAAQGAKKVLVPRPNLADGFEATPPATSPGSPPVDSGDDTTAPAVPSEAAEIPQPEPAPKRGVAAQRQDSCQAKWAAFRASTECFATCGKHIGRSGRRNNAGCVQCEDMPMPRC